MWGCNLRFKSRNPRNFLGQNEENLFFRLDSYFNVFFRVCKGSKLNHIRSHRIIGGKYD